MALKLAVDFKRKDLLSVFPEDIVVNPDNRGRQFPPTQAEVERLAESIIRDGQLQPITVAIRPDRTLEAVAGFTRLEAILYINTLPEYADNKRRISAQVVDGNAEDQFLANIAENALRNDTTAVDDAHNIRKLERDFGYDDQQVAGVYGKSIAWVTQTKKILSLSKAQQKLVHQGQLSAATAYLLADINEEDRQQVLDEVEADGEEATTANVLKKARKKEVLNKNVALKFSEVKAVFNYLVENEGTSEPLKKLSKQFLKYVSGEITETTFIGNLRKFVE